jgi:hypothetical protein
LPYLTRTPQEDERLIAPLSTWICLADVLY